MVQRILIAIKGAMMGLADMVPGVSGGTIALVVGVYRPFVDALRSLHLRWVVPLLAWAFSGLRNREARNRFVHGWRSMHLGFLVNLGLGMLIAVVVMVNVIPPLMQAYPQMMRGLFFGLVAASVVVPWRMMNGTAGGERLKLLAVMLLTAGLVFVMLGAQASPWVERETVAVEAEGTSLAAFARKERSTLTPREIYASLPPADQQAIARENPKLDLEAAQKQEAGEAFDRAELPVSLQIEVARPAPLYVLLCGIVAICAMLLPGVSGSFILVMFGMYYVMANTLRGTLHGGIEWLRGLAGLPIEHLVLIALFMLGAFLGLLGFSRLLSWLLHHRLLARPTLAALSGLMLGSLGVLWPYKSGPGVEARNVWPRELAEPATLGALALMLLGGLLVLALHWFGTKLAPTPGPAERDEPPPCREGSGERNTGAEKPAPSRTDSPNQSAKKSPT